jgi:diguanylate cyclase (GGDEF)-like protein
LIHETLHDPLTTLPNRRLFVNRLEHAVAWGHRNSDSLAAVLYLDLDRFKSINDSLGHDAGDQLLIQVADRLKSSLRAIDTVARMGGDEFAILLESVSTPEEVITAVQRMQACLALPYEWKGKSIDSGASIGVVINLTAYEQIDDIVRDADIAMYQAKSDGGNEFRVFADREAP